MEEFKLEQIEENSIINKVSNRKPLEFEKVDSLTSKEYEEKMRKRIEEKNKKTLSCDVKTF